MNIGKYKNTITVQQLYDYALQHNYLGADVNVVIDIINRENKENKENKENIFNEIKSTDNSTVKRDFSKIVEYSFEDLIALLTSK